MTFEEYLKTIEGLTDEQVAAITGGMKENKLYISGEENIDERYGKLKGQHDTATTQLTDAQALIAQLKPQAEGNETLQSQVADYEQKVAAAEARAAKAERDASVKVELLAKGALPEDVDYLMYRIDQGDAEVKFGDDGKLSGMEDAVKALKASCPRNFTEEGGTGKFSGNRLPGGGSTNQGTTKEQFDKMTFQERNALYTNDREAYNALAGKTEN